MEDKINRKKILLVTRPIAPPWDEASKNFAYSLATNSPNFDFYLLTNGIIPNLPLHIHQESIYTSNSFNFFQKIRLLKFLRKSKDKFDIIHYLFTPTKLTSSLLRNLLRNKLLNKRTKTIQTIATLREDLFKDADFKKILFADRIVTYSKYAKNKLNKMGFNNVEQIYPGIDLELYKPAEKDKNLIENLKLSAEGGSAIGGKIEKFIVTYPGEFTRLDATDDIVEAIISLCHSERSEESRGSFTPLRFIQDDIKFVFACRIKNKDDLIKKEEVQKKLKEKGLLDLVRFPETFTTLDKMLNASDLVIFPIREMKGKFDVPLVVVEAMACEKAVIISDLPILKEFANEQNSVIIKSGDVKQLMDAISELYQNKEKREMIGKNARKFVEENFNIKKISDKYKNIYNSL